MIEYFLLLLIIIVIFSISILIYTIINNKEGFRNIDDTKDIKEARLKLNLEKNLINYQKGSKGFDGEQGKQGPTPLPPDDGIIGEMGDNGIDGKNYGSLFLKNNENEVIDSLLNTNTKDPKHPDFNIEVPNAEQGATGFVGTIEFVNHKKEIIGSYYPPDDALVKNSNHIIIDVPQGIVGDTGDDGSNGIHPQGPQGERGENGELGEEGERGDPGPNANKGGDGGGGNEDYFNNVKVSNKVCFNEDYNSCIDIDILKTFINYDDYLIKLENRRLRIIRKLCYLEFYDEYNNKKHENRDELILEYKRQLQEIYDFNDEPFDYSAIVDKDSGTCPEFPEKPECKFDDNHLNEENEFLFDKCGCEKLTTDCGIGQFISRPAYKGKDDKDNDIYISDNKCAECTLKREHVDEENNELYIGCDGIYDGISASCKENQYINITGGSDYSCTDVQSGYYVASNRISETICPKGNKAVNGKLIECTGNQYQNETGKDSCKNCTNKCENGKYRTGNCTSTTNFSCQQCAGGNYCTDGINERACTTSSCVPEQYISKECSPTNNRICSACPHNKFCNGTTATTCTPCNENQYEVTRCTLTSNPICSDYNAWRDCATKGGKVGYQNAGRDYTWAVCRAAGGYDYTLIYWGPKIIYAGPEVDGIVTVKMTENIIYQFKQGLEYDNGDDVKLDWHRHSSFDYNNKLPLGDHTHWNDAICYHLILRSCQW